MFENKHRGPVATKDMKHRIRALQVAGEDVVEALMRRTLEAETGNGYTYEYAATKEDTDDRP